MNRQHVNCPYCKQSCELVPGEVIYPHRRDLYEKKFYQCKPCVAHIGCHPGTSKPLGTPAKSTLRNLRRQAHALFDPLWQSSRSPIQGKDRRKRAYEWLAHAMELPRETAHIGLLDEIHCRRLLYLLNLRKTQFNGYKSPIEICA